MARNKTFRRLVFSVYVRRRPIFALLQMRSLAQPRRHRRSRTAAATARRRRHLHTHTYTQWDLQNRFHFRVQCKYSTWHN